MALRSAGVVGVLVLTVADVCRYLGTWRLVRPGVWVPEAHEDKDITQVPYFVPWLVLQRNLFQEGDVVVS